MEEQLAQQLLKQVESDYDTIAEHFSDTRSAQWREVQQLIHHYVKPRNRVLDLGCGNGRVADLVNQIKASYIGIDVSPQLIELARRLHPKNEFHTGSMMHIDAADHTFNHTLMIASFHHIPSEDYRIHVLQEVKRVTQPGGYIVMTNWNLHQWRFMKLRYGFLLQKLFRIQGMDTNDVLVPWKHQQGRVLAQRYYHGFTQREMKRLAHKTGLRVIDQYYETHGIHLSRIKSRNLVTVLQVKKISSE
ncbi:MAG TPA: class I SAM-dependent methyltransferase [Patescibacteria group bacterium]|nr:class I SAM-dependent methyltransferase [Patescibacteria group bacterium]